MPGATATNTTVCWTEPRDSPSGTSPGVQPSVCSPTTPTTTTTPGKHSSPRRGPHPYPWSDECATRCSAGVWLPDQPGTRVLAVEVSRAGTSGAFSEQRTDGGNQP